MSDSHKGDASDRQGARICEIEMAPNRSLGEQHGERSLCRQSGRQGRSDRVDRGLQQEDEASGAGANAAVKNAASE